MTKCIGWRLSYLSGINVVKISFEQYRAIIDLNDNVVDPPVPVFLNLLSLLNVISTFSLIEACYQKEWKKEPMVIPQK
jgi:hypothetical protein